MNKLFLISVVVLFSAFFVPIRAQELRGRVTSEGRPVEYANVGVVSAAVPYGGVTDGTDVIGFGSMFISSGGTGKNVTVDSKEIPSVEGVSPKR